MSEVSDRIVAAGRLSGWLDEEDEAAIARTAWTRSVINARADRRAATHAGRRVSAVYKNDVVI